MTPLEQLLQAVRQRNAEALILMVGEPAQIKSGGDIRPLTRQVLAEPQLRALLASAMTPEEASLLHEGKEVRFRAVAGGESFEGVASHSAGILVATVVPGRRKAAPAVPAATPGPRAVPLAAPATAAGERPIDALLRLLAERGGSDLHLAVRHPPMMRVDGTIQRLEGQDLAPERVAELVVPTMPDRNRRQFEATHDTDFAYELPGVARFRANVYRDRHGMTAAYRCIPSRVLTARELGLSQPVQDLCYLTKGLVLVTGPTGSGKSTTLASLVDLVNRERQDHIITIEDPIEFVHESKGCLVSQREVSVHTSSFKMALRAALREDPDVVLVGEMRDLETIAIALETAVTGHLVFGTLHTSTAIQTVDRVIDQFPADRQTQVRVMLADCLKAVVAQTLLRKKGGGRVAAMEVLLGTPAVGNLIREGKTFQIPSLMQTGKGAGMTVLNDVLLDYVKHGLVEPREAYVKAVDKDGLARELARAGIALDLRGRDRTPAAPALAAAG